MNDTEHARTTANTRAFAAARDAFTLRQLNTKLDWFRFPWTKGVELEPCLRTDAYLGDAVIGLTPDGEYYTFKARDGAWMEVSTKTPWVLVDVLVDELAGYIPPLPKRSEYRRGQR